jgi:hypothetical protein
MTTEEFRKVARQKQIWHHTRGGISGILRSYAVEFIRIEDTNRIVALGDDDLFYTWAEEFVELLGENLEEAQENRPEFFV